VRLRVTRTARPAAARAATRPEMRASGFQDVDYVLTTRELARMIKEAGIDFASLPDEPADEEEAGQGGGQEAGEGGPEGGGGRTGRKVI